MTPTCWVIGSLSILASHDEEKADRVGVAARPQVREVVD
jgi:hypothetical protein